MKNPAGTVTQTQSAHLAATLRQRIITGEYGPGGRLPTFQEIEENFHVSRSVAQLAIRRLKRDGFVRSRSSQGLFVTDRPPHLRRYGLVFQVPHGDPTWSRFDDLLVKRARLQQQQGSDQEFDVFDGLDDHRVGPEVLERLRDEVHHDRLAGLILTPGTHDLADRAPFNDPRLPKVFVFCPETYPWRPIVTSDGPQMYARALTWLAEKGRSRVATIRLSDYPLRYDWKSEYERAGLEYHPQWIQAVGRGDPTVLHTLIPLLMDYSADRRPDGLFITDDNLVEHAAAAVAAMGMRVGGDLDIVGHCNWPLPGPSLLPVCRIGYDTGSLLSCCLAAIDAQRRGETAPEIQRVPALFENEVGPV